MVAFVLPADSTAWVPVLHTETATGKELNPGAGWMVTSSNPVVDAVMVHGTEKHGVRLTPAATATPGTDVAAVITYGRGDLTDTLEVVIGPPRINRVAFDPANAEISEIPAETLAARVAVVAAEHAAAQKKAADEKAAADKAAAEKAAAEKAAAEKAAADKKATSERPAVPLDAGKE